MSMDPQWWEDCARTAYTLLLGIYRDVEGHAFLAPESEEALEAWLLRYQALLPAASEEGV